MLNSENISEKQASDSFSDDVESHIFGKKDKTTFKDVGRMAYEKDQISLKIIHPLKHADLYKSYEKK
ncbi:hypothetical protein GCM10011506_38660 [Marivirga lumbricoides]|uniref:Uncharacterized protein n=1 Tax=Marivirga lumbricoides TaxID=1046115 RepID=A0ABQ1MYU7_9BACT|nr:hypothetical protein GCM10011506_38660 [Marivirga lumbricoides]